MYIYIYKRQPHLRSQTLLDGFMAELQNHKGSISDAKRSLEVVYAKTLGKSDAAIREDPTLLAEVSSGNAAMDSCFTSFTGTCRSIKMSIDAQLIFLISMFVGNLLECRLSFEPCLFQPDASLAQEPARPKKAKAKAKAQAQAEVPEPAA